MKRTPARLDHRRGQRHRPRHRAGTGEKRLRVGLIDIDARAWNRWPLSCAARERRSSPASRRRLAAASRCSRPSRRSRRSLGPIDVLVACAGFGTLTLVPDLALDTLRRTFEVNMFGVAESIEAVLPGMLARGRGHLVGVASLAGYRGFPWMISYSASKAALIAYLEALRPGLAQRGVTVTTVCPGFVRTAMSTGFLTSAR